MKKTGTCLCGAVRYEIEDAPETTSACHCNMCRKWSGGVYLGYHAVAGKARVEGEENVTLYKSSDWAERGFCKTCGSSLFYRLTAPGPHRGEMHFGLGTLDDGNGIALTEEIFVDEKPDGYAFAGETHKMTGAEVVALYTPED